MPMRCGALNLGVNLTLMLGGHVPRPAPDFIVEAIKNIEVTHKDDGPSGFQITFHVGRSGPGDLLDYRLVSSPLIRQFNRVILVVRFTLAPEVLMDGMITNIQLNPDETPGESTLTITGEDVSVMMDLTEESRSYPAQPDFTKVTQIIARYIGEYGLVPPTMPASPEPMNARSPLEQIDQQPANLTDRAYLTGLAQMYGYVFYITPGPVPGVNRVHWGPPERSSILQPALSLNMGPFSNIESIHFRYDGLAPQRVRYTERGESGMVESRSSSRNLPLARDIAEARRATQLTGSSCRAHAQAQGVVDRSFDGAVTATGELNGVRYNRLLQPRKLVALRGAGDTYSGAYYVKEVTHRIGSGDYKQAFTLQREGTGSTIPAAPP